MSCPLPFRQLVLRYLVTIAALMVAPVALLAEEPLEPIPAYDNFAGPLLTKLCSDCHSGDDAEAGLAIEKLATGDQFQQHRREWKKLASRLKMGDMPPEGSEMPTQDQRERLIAWIEHRLDDFDCSGAVNPGWVTLRRLNRDQYRNTVFDLLGVKFDPNESFPADELAFGFDNNADVLSLTPALMEKYLDASQQIASDAILSPESITEPLRKVRNQKWKGGNPQGDDIRALYSNGRIEFRHFFRSPGRYLVRASVAATQAGDEPVRMGFVAEDKQVQTIELRGDEDEWEKVQFELIVSERGGKTLGIAFLNDYYVEDSGNAIPVDRNMFVQSINVIGPIDDAMAGKPAGQRRWFDAVPTPDQWRHADEWKPIARRSIEKFASRAFRRPASSGEVDRLLTLMEYGRSHGDSYERAVSLVVEAVLASPKFLFIGSTEPVEEGTPTEVDEFELASRLSYFLWSSMPDAPLLKLAHQGKLRQNLDQQIRRMLRDKRARQLSKNFTGQWLGTRLLAEVEPDKKLFGEFDAELRDAMAREAELIFDEVLQQNAPVATLLSADFTYLNQRLAKHYNIPDVQGGHFRRVSLSKLPSEAGLRGGVLTTAGVLTVTSFPTRTAPVIRGKWVLENLLGEEPPEPPPGVPPLEEAEEGESKVATVREQLEKHRESPTCFACHAQMDPLGFALESYDPVGRWRTEDRGKPIDTSGELPGGVKIDGAADLRAALVKQKDNFRRCLVEKMLTYALGRGLEYYDTCAVETICEQMQENDNRMVAMIEAIVRSDPFQKRRLVLQPKEAKP